MKCFPAGPRRKERKSERLPAGVRERTAASYQGTPCAELRISNRQAEESLREIHQDLERIEDELLLIVEEVETASLKALDEWIGTVATASIGIRPVGEDAQLLEGLLDMLPLSKSLLAHTNDNEAVDA